MKRKKVKKIKDEASSSTSSRGCKRKSSKAEKPNGVTKKSIEEAFAVWEDSDVETAMLELVKFDEAEQKCVLAFSEEDVDGFSVTFSGGSGALNGEEKREYFVFSENDDMMGFVGEMTTYCERTRTFFDLLTECASVYLRLNPDDYDENSDEGQGHGQHEDDGFSLESAEFRESIALAQLKKRWVDKEQVKRKQMEEAGEKDKESTEDKKVTQIFTTKAATGVLINDLMEIYKNTEQLGFSAEAVNDDIYHWKVFLHKFPNDSNVGQNQAKLREKHGYEYVELDIRFKMDLYPFYPPFVRLVRPHFSGFLMGRVASMELLKLSHWDPVKSMCAVLSEVAAVIARYGEVDVDNEANDLKLFPEGAYSPLEHSLSRIEMLTDIGSRHKITKDTDDAEHDTPKKAKSQSTSASPTNSTPETDAKQAPSSAPPATKPTSSSTQKSFWAKGTGYGHGAGPSASWDVEAYLAAQKAKDEEIAGLLKVILELVENSETQWTDKVVFEKKSSKYLSVMSASCLVPLLTSYMRNDSILDICRHHLLYNVIVKLCTELANISWTRSLLGVLDDSTPLYDLLALRHKQATRYMTQIAKNDTSDSTSSDTAMVELILKCFDACKEHQADIMPKSKKKSSKKSSSCASSNTIAQQQQQELQEQYLEVMGEMQFDECSIVDGGGPKHHYHTQISQTRGTPPQKKLVRLAQESSNLCTSLPLSVSSSVFLRLDSDRMDVMRFMITGPEDTPYENGCFQFDCFFPHTYPGGPPVVNLQTTGNGSVRFNPNLYNCGKVCLSLLGTWSGAQGEQWNENTSSLLQVLVSIQSLILVPEPYFNEPGYEKSMGTKQGDAACKAYNTVIRLGTMRHAILAQLKSPSKGFEDVVRAQFYLKKEKVLDICRKWVEEEGKNSDFTKCLKDIETQLGKLKPPSALSSTTTTTTTTTKE